MAQTITLHAQAHARTYAHTHVFSCHFTPCLWGLKGLYCGTRRASGMCARYFQQTVKGASLHRHIRAENPTDRCSVCMTMIMVQVRYNESAKPNHPKWIFQNNCFDKNGIVWWWKRAGNITEYA